MKLPQYVLLDKAVGQTPLQCMEEWRVSAGVSADIPLTYAGRLDPIASGKLLVLVGEECKKKDEYLSLDKTYVFSVLFGIGSDTHDVLGRLETSESAKIQNLSEQLQKITEDLVGDIELPYPHFSSKTVDGKPLFQWTLEGQLDKIDIPTKASNIYSLSLDKTETLSRIDVCDQARAKIDTIPEVTDENKKLGADFRRTDIRIDWENIKLNDTLPDHYHIAHFTCNASSGTYMRTLAKLVGEQLSPTISSLAWSIHRIEIKNL